VWTRSRRRGLVEKFVSLQAEISVIAAAARRRRCRVRAVRESAQQSHPRSWTTARLPIPAGVAARAREIAARFCEALDYVGILCVEVLRHDRRRLCSSTSSRRVHTTRASSPLMPRSPVSSSSRCARSVASSGIDRAAEAGAMANLSATCGQMANRTGRLPAGFPDVKLHLYGKSQPRPGRRWDISRPRAHRRRGAEISSVAARDALLSSVGHP
jgi:5-(carboxyamino)imidazole ribonucleotide synthase